jgi:hypothetical protein
MTSEQALSFLEAEIKQAVYSGEFKDVQLMNTWYHYIKFHPTERVGQMAVLQCEKRLHARQSLDIKKPR